MKSKKKSQVQHAQKRAAQRYGVTVGSKTYKQLCSRIQKNKDCVFLQRQSNRVSMFAVKMNEEWVPVIYDKTRHTIVTFLPQTALEPFKNLLV